MGLCFFYVILQFLFKCIISFLLDLIIEDFVFEFGDIIIFYDWKECSVVFDQFILNDIVIVLENFRKFFDSELRKELLKYGEIFGFIMLSIRNVYIKRLVRFYSGVVNLKVILFRLYILQNGRESEKWKYFWLVQYIKVVV